MNIEANLHVGHGDEYIENAVALLAESTSPMLDACADATEAVVGWLERNNRDRFAWLKSLRHSVSEFLSPRSLIKNAKPSASTVSSPVDTESGTQESEKGAKSVDPRTRTPEEAIPRLIEVLERFKTKERYD